MSDVLFTIWVLGFFFAIYGILANPRNFEGAMARSVLQDVGLVLIAMALWPLALAIALDKRPRR